MKERKASKPASKFGPGSIDSIIRDLEKLKSNCSALHWFTINQLIWDAKNVKKKFAAYRNQKRARNRSRARMRT